MCQDLSTALVFGGLDRNIVSVDNVIGIASSGYSIFTSSFLYIDPTYNPYAGMTWLQRNWRQLLFVVLFVLSVVLMCIPGTQPFGLGMFKMSMKFAVSGAITSGVINGLQAALTGQNVVFAVVCGMVQGFLEVFLF